VQALSRPQAPVAEHARGPNRPARAQQGLEPVPSLPPSASSSARPLSEPGPRSPLSPSLRGIVGAAAPPVELFPAPVSSQSAIGLRLKTPLKVRSLQSPRQMETHHSPQETPETSPKDAPILPREPARHFAL
jgi:hypothetical protein